MTTRVLFTNFTRTEALENFVRQHIDAVFEKFRRDRNASSSVYLHIENARSHTGRDMFVCEVSAHSKLFPNVFLKKSSESMYEAIAETGHALKNVLSRAHGRYLSRRRRDRKERLLISASE